MLVRQINRHCLPIGYNLLDSFKKNLNSLAADSIEGAHVTLAPFMESI